MNRFLGFLIVSVLLVIVGPARAESTIDIYSQVLKRGSSVQSLDEELFGDRISTLDGTVEFNITDVSTSGNSGIPLSIGRKFNPNEQTKDQQGRFTNIGMFGPYWNIDVPYMHGKFDTLRGWTGPVAQPGLGTKNRCSEGGSGPGPTYGLGEYRNVTYTSNDFFTGVTVNIPGKGIEPLLRFPNYETKTINGIVYYYKTKPDWIFSCVVLPGGNGEGFLARLPDGTTYRFDYLSSRPAGNIWDSTCYIANGGSAGTMPTKAALEQDAATVCHENYALLLSDVFLYATEVTDRFGNKVNYDYSGGKLIKVRSSDGAVIDLRYDNSSGWISQIQTGNRVWTYNYTSALSEVILPDSSKWTYQYPSNIADITRADPWNVWRSCVVNIGSRTTSQQPGTDQFGVSESETFTMTHPSGAVGEFKFRKLLHGTKAGEAGCHLIPTGGFGGCCGVYTEVTWPTAYLAISLYEKRISGGGRTLSQLIYEYAPSWTAPYTSTTTIRGSDGRTETFKYGNNQVSDYGLLLQHVMKGANGESITYNYSYLPSTDGQPFGPTSGIGMSVAGGNASPGYVASQNRPLIRMEMVDNFGSKFTNEVATGCASSGVYCFDSYVRPTRQIRTGSP